MAHAHVSKQERGLVGHSAPREYMHVRYGISFISTSLTKALITEGPSTPFFMTSLSNFSPFAQLSNSATGLSLNHQRY